MNWDKVIIHLEHAAANCRRATETGITSELRVSNFTGQLMCNILTLALRAGLEAEPLRDAADRDGKKLNAPEKVLQNLLALRSELLDERVGAKAEIAMKINSCLFGTYRPYKKGT